MICLKCLRYVWNILVCDVSFLLIPGRDISNHVLQLNSKNIERHTANTIVSWPNPNRWVIVHSSDLMMIIRQTIYNRVSLIFVYSGWLYHFHLTDYHYDPDTWERYPPSTNRIRPTGFWMDVSLFCGNHFITFNSLFTVIKTRVVNITDVIGATKNLQLNNDCVTKVIHALQTILWCVVVQFMRNYS